MKIARSFVVIAALSISFAYTTLPVANAQGNLVTYNFEGTFNQTSSLFNVGDTFSGSYTLEPTAPFIPHPPGEITLDIQSVTAIHEILFPGTGWHITVFSSKVPDFSIGLGFGAISVGNDTTWGDRYITTLSGGGLPLPLGLELRFFQIDLTDPFASGSGGDMLADGGIGTFPDLSLAHYAGGRFFIESDPGFCTQCRITLTSLTVGSVLPDTLTKEIISGPDVDINGEIDLAVGAGQFQTTQYDFDIVYNSSDGPPVLIEDTVPAEWDVVLLDDDGGNATAASANVRGRGKGATKIDWEPDPAGGMITVWADTRQKRRNGKFSPTSCGALYLNDGAQAFEIDPATGEPILDEFGERLPPILESNQLCLAAVSDINGGGLIPDGSGDEDGDGVSDLEEACGIFTDPCVEDTDNDGVNDGLDACPLEGPPNPALGELQDPDGCNRQAQCSDGLDNDNDGPIDFAGGDLSCDDILDDSEDTNDNPLTDCVEANGLTWCFNNDACGEACNDVCAAKGLTPVADSNAWFEAQNTAAECQVIANALGGFTGVSVSHFAFACLEDLPGGHTVGGGLVGPDLLCSSFFGCPDLHRTNMDELGIACGVVSRRSICPCE